MFELIFKYPASVFAKGKFVWLSGWPWWALGLLVVAASAGLWWNLERSHARMARGRKLAIWGLQSAMAALALILLWHPAISVASLKPQQNIVTVLLDDSRSMLQVEDGQSRLQRATGGLESGVLADLKKRFQVRLFRFGRDIERIDLPAKATGEAGVTRIGDAVEQALADASAAPLGAIVVLSDGADNSGGIPRETLSRIRERRIPVHTVGYGKERITPDIEVTDAVVPARTLPDSRLAAQVTFRQHGFNQRKAKLTVKEGGKVLAQEDIPFTTDDAPQTQTVQFPAGPAGVKTFEFAIEPLSGEVSAKNNSVSRLVNVQTTKPRVLYFEGEPRWEYKFIRRAIEEDQSLELVSIMRTTQNKYYRQGIATPSELEDGFPVKAEELFAYSGLIIGSAEAGSFTNAQQELIKEFAARRGGGVLYLGGRASLGDGGWGTSLAAEMIPVRLGGKGGFHREKVTFSLTDQGRDSLITRLEDDPERNAKRWTTMPQLGDFQEVGDPKPGAVVLGSVTARGRKIPSLVIQRYGAGRVAVFATGASWRWQMLQSSKDRTHEVFWQQMLRWLATDSPGLVSSSTPRPVLADETKVEMRADVRDKEYKPVGEARVEARIVGPSGAGETIELRPDPVEEGIYTGTWTAAKTGSYAAELVAIKGTEEAGRDVLMFRREDGIAENFQLGQNRELLTGLSAQTGGQYFTPDQLSKLPELVQYSEAGITSRETKDLWDLPLVFLLALSLKAAEWLLRRKWGAI